MLRVGVITSAHGIKGEVKVFPTTDDAKRFKELKEVILDTGKEHIPMEIEHVKFFKNMVILKFRGYDNINEIEKYKSRDLLITRDQAVDLEPDEYFITDLIGLTVVSDQGAELGGDAGAITGTVKIRFSDSGSSTQAVPYRGMFNATVGGSNLNQVAPTGTLVVSDALLGKPFATKEVTLKLSFPDVATREAYQSGKPAYLTITINNITGVLYLVKRGDGYVATKTVG